MRERNLQLQLFYALFLNMFISPILVTLNYNKFLKIFNLSFDESDINISKYDDLTRTW